MAWETRAGIRYYYRSKRDRDGCVKKEYFGRGVAALAAAAEDECRRLRESNVRQQIADELQKTCDARRLTDRLQFEATTMLSAAFLAMGFHRQNYGRWRRRRGMITSEQEVSKNETSERMTDREARLQIRELAAKAQEGEIDAVVEIRRLLNQHPSIFRSTGDLASHAHRAWINLIAGENLELRESLIRRVGDLKKQLRGESADTAITRLVIDQVVGSWLELHYAEMRDAVASSQSLKWAEFRLKQLESAHRRHMKGIGALAALQRLLPQVTEVAPEALEHATHNTKREQGPLASRVPDRVQETGRFQLCSS
jgi:hypothetical protein